MSHMLLFLCQILIKFENILLSKKGKHTLILGRREYTRAFQEQQDNTANCNNLSLELKHQRESSALERPRGDPGDERWRELQVLTQGDRDMVTASKGSLVLALPDDPQHENHKGGSIQLTWR